MALPPIHPLIIEGVPVPLAVEAEGPHAVVAFIKGHPAKPAADVLALLEADVVAHEARRRPAAPDRPAAPAAPAGKPASPVAPPEG